MEGQQVSTLTKDGKSMHSVEEVATFSDDSCTWSRCRQVPGAMPMQHRETEIGDGLKERRGWRGDHTRELKPKTIQSNPSFPHQTGNERRISQF